MKLKALAMQAVGQLRAYSLVDLLLLLAAARVPPQESFGSVLLWIGFLLFLEESHAHPYRMRWPAWAWCLPVLMGIAAYPAALPFLACSWAYARKDQGNGGLWSPAWRAGQTAALLAPYVPLAAVLAAASLIAARNLIGDLRDTEKDRKEGLRTWPVAICLRQWHPSCHLLATLGTTWVWWRLCGYPIAMLLGAWALEALTYNLTPRDPA